MSRSRPDEEIRRRVSPLTRRAGHDHLGVERDQGRGRVRRIHRHAPARAHDAVFPVHGTGRRRVADVASGAVAGPSATVVPATGVLGDVAAEGALVADLRRRHQPGRRGQEGVATHHVRVLGDVGEARHRPDLESAVRSRGDAPELVHAPEIDHRRRALDTVLEPVEGVESSGEHPALVAVFLHEAHRVVDARRLKELERRDHVTHDSHFDSPSRSDVRVQQAVRPRPTFQLRQNHV